MTWLVALSVSRHSWDDDGEQINLQLNAVLVVEITRYIDIALKKFLGAENR